MGGNHQQLHFTDEDTEAPLGKLTWSKSLEGVTERAGFEPR